MLTVGSTGINKIVKEKKAEREMLLLRFKQPNLQKTGGRCVSEEGGWGEAVRLKGCRVEGKGGLGRKGSWGVWLGFNSRKKSSGL